MLWDASSESWDALGFFGQPAGALATANGEVVATWSGPIPEEQVLESLDQL